MRRGGHGVWCGYVGIGPEHPLFGLPTNHPLNLPASWFDGRRALEGASPFDIFIHALSGAKSIEDACPISLAFQVHGGVNYASDHVPDSDPGDRWWFGFDCGHAGDYIPGKRIDKMMQELVESMPEEVRDTMRRIVNSRIDDNVYRDQQYVVSECQSLAAQLVAVVAALDEVRSKART
jgi:hypothetical protein